jgi:hypothetical protein
MSLLDQQKISMYHEHLSIGASIESVLIDILGQASECCYLTWFLEDLFV